MLTTAFHRLNRGPEIPDGQSGGGDGGQGGEANPAPVTPAAPAPSARDYGRDIDSLRGTIGEFGKKFDSFHSDYQSKFGGGSQKQDSNKEPVLSDFPNTQEGVLKFIDARADYKAGQRYETLQNENKKSQSAEAAKAKRSANLQSHVGRISEAMTRYKDFDAIINNAAMQLPENVVDDVIESPFSADLHYHLSKNAGDLYKIVNAYNQSERAGAKMLGALEHKFEMEAAARKAAAKKTRFGATETVDSEVGGNAGEDEENESIARESFGLKKKTK